ncbi:MAG TPA: hypothetical protein VJ623_12045 [Holophagaceae bacterium]|nr:hypothetical protein [Holophagaceae bacterium]
MAFLLHLLASTRGRIRSRQRSFLAAFMAVLGLVVMAACGGGGGGGASDPGLNISPSTLSFSARRGDPTPPAKGIQITVTSSSAAYVGADWGGGPGPSWIAATGLTGSGRTWSLGLQITDTNLAPGTYTATLRAGIADSKGNIIGTRNATITYQVLPDFHATPNTLSFDYIQGRSAPAGQVISLQGTAGNWSATAYPSWIHLSATSGGTPDTLTVSVDPAGLSVGDYEGSVSFHITSDGSLLQVPVALHVAQPSLQASASNLTFGGVHGGALAPQSLGLSMNSGEAITWTATADDAWVVLGKATGSTPDTLAISVDAALGPVTGGVYHSQVHFSGTAGGQPVSKTISVYLSLSAASLDLSHYALNFGGVNGDALAGQALGVSMNNVQALAWTATASAPWIVLSKASGTTSDLVLVSADPSKGSLASGNYLGTITFQANYLGATLSRVIQVTLSLTKPYLLLYPGSLSLGGPTGRDLATQPLSLTLNTGPVAYPWTASTPNGWIHADRMSGNVSDLGDILHLSPNATELAGGTYQGYIDFSVPVNGDIVTASLPVTLNLESHKLLVTDTGAAFASMPGLSSLTRTLQVRDNLGATTGWTASSDQPWLTVTPSGTTADGLVLTANPLGMAPDSLNFATITLTSPDASIQNAETVRVGFWVGSTSPAPSSVTSLPCKSLAVDPIRPYAYVHNGGTTISIYHAYTCALVGTIPSVAAQLGDMTISNDGSTLFVTDNINFKIVPVDLRTLTVGTPWALGAPIPAYIQYVRTNGKELVLAGNGCIFDAKTGAYLGGTALGATYNYTVSASLVGDHFAIDSMVHTLDFTSLNGGQVLVGPTQFPAATAWNTADYAFSNDGTRFYMAVKAPYDFYVVDTSTSNASLPLVQTLPGNAYPNNVEVARDNRVFCALEGYGPPDAWIYEPAGAELAHFQLSYIGTTTRQLKVTGDGLRMISFGNDAYYQGAELVFTTVAP